MECMVLYRLFALRSTLSDAVTYKHFGTLWLVLLASAGASLKVE